MEVSKEQLAGTLLFPPSDSLFKSSMRAEISYSSPDPPSTLTVAPGTWQAFGPKEVTEWAGDMWQTNERCCCLVSGRQELGSKPEGAAGCEQADLSFPRGSWAGLTLDQGPGGWFRGARRWDSSGLALGWWEEKILPPSPNHKSSSQRRPLWPGPPCSWPHPTGTELQTLSRPPSGSQGKLLGKWHGNWQIT